MKQVIRVLAGMFLAQGFSAAAVAASLYVAPTGNDTNTCLSPSSPCRTLNGALGKATPGDTILVAVGTYTGTGSEVVLVQKAIILSGGWNATFAAQNGYSSIDGEGARRGMQVFTGLAAVVLERLIIENGIRGLGPQGGGIANNGNLTVNECIIRNNQDGGIFNANVLTLNDSVVSANFNNSGGGGIENLAFTTINRTTITSNQTTSEGGGLRMSTGQVTVTNSTLTGNVAQFIGGAIANRTNGTLVLNYDTIAGNSGNFGGGGIAYESTSTTSLRGTILSGNIAGFGVGGPDCLGSGSMASQGHNLIGKGIVPGHANCIVATTGDQVGTDANPIDPLLGPLADNGGPTATRALLIGSPAIDAGDDTACSAAPVSSIDQRGFNRFRRAGAHCDSGSFEKGSAPFGDVDRDRRTDWTVFRPASGVWYSALSNGGATATGWGIAGDVDVLADYDGDGKADIAVWRPATGTWYIVQSATGTVRTDTWGTNGDIPIAGDIDGDGKDDLVVWRPSTGVWFANTSTGGTSVLGWGTTGDQPLLADYDGDGKADFTIWRPGTGVWYIAKSSGGTSIVGWGVATDIPVVGDFDGDFKNDVTVFRPSTGEWFVIRSTGGTIVVTWGTSGDVPVSGDWDGDGRSDFSVWRPTNGVWYTQYAIGGGAAVGWGMNGDRPIGRLPGP